MIFVSLTSWAAPAQSLKQKGDQAWTEGRYSKAASYYKKASQEAIDEKTKSEILYNLGLTYYQRGEWGSALDAFEGALTLNPSAAISQQIHYYSGLSYYGARLRKQALHHLKKASESEASVWTQKTAALMLKRAQNEADKRFSLFSSVGYLFDINVPLETRAGLKHDPTVEHLNGFSSSLNLIPEYAVSFGDRSRFLISNDLYLNYQFAEEHRQYNFYKNDLKSEFRGMHTWGALPVHSKAIFGTEASFSEDKDLDSLDLIRNEFYVEPRAIFSLSEITDLDIGTRLMFDDFKQTIGRDEPQARDGFYWDVNAILGANFWGARWRAGYELNRYLPIGGWYKGHTHGFMAESEFSFLRGKLSFKMTQNFAKLVHAPILVDENGTFFKAAWAKVFDNLVGISLQGIAARNNAEPSTTSYDRVAVGGSIFYNF